jgi:formylglycine-generating enzyme required for sulfatase activity
MKIRLLLPFLLLGLIGIASCSKSSEKPKDKPVVEVPDDPDDPGPTDPSQTLIIRFGGDSYQNSSTLELGYRKDAILLILETEPGWTATASADWIKLASYEGEAGKMGLIAGFAKNDFIPRSGTITFKSGNKTHIMTIDQSGAPQLRLTIDGIQADFVLVEGGNFLMGDSDLPESRYRTSVNVSSFYMATTETTNALWEAVTGSLPYDDLEDFEGHMEYDRPNHPVSGVSWTLVNEIFFPELRRQTEINFRLPTEAEWEYAAGGGKYKEGFIYSGSNTLNDVAWNYYNCDDKQEVGQLMPNELGLYDMSGNVSEWCSDWYIAPYQMEDGVSDPTGPATGTHKITRGGDFSEQELFGLGTCYIRYRYPIVPGCYDGCWGNSGHPDEPECFRCDKTGFRIVLAF